MQPEQPPPPEIVEPEKIEPFSPAIMKLAQTHKLGEPELEYLASFPLDPDGRTIGLTIVVWLLLLPIVFVKQLPYLWIIVWVVVPPLLTLLIWATAFLLHRYRKQTHYQRVYVCTSGLLCQRLNTIEPIHWHHIKTVGYDAVGNCQIYSNDGAIFLFAAPLQQLGDLCTHVEQAILPYHLPQLLTSYRDGLPIAFGPLSISQQGIGLTQQNVALFAWNKIQSVERRFDSLMLKLYNDRVLGFPLTVHEIPNVNIAQALISAILEEAAVVTQELHNTEKPEVQKGKRGQRRQKKQDQDQEIKNQATGTLTNIMGDPISTATTSKRSVMVYERGFLYLDKASKKLDIVRWDEVARVIRRIQNNNGAVDYSIEVTRNDETTFHFPRTQPLIAGIGLYIEQKVAEWALPTLLQQYDANESTAFGKLMIDQTGITYNKRSLAWSEIYQVRILQPNSAHISIKQRGYNQEWQVIPVNKVPDCYLLQLLVDHVLGTHAAIQR